MLSFRRPETGDPDIPHSNACILGLRKKFLTRFSCAAALATCAILALSGCKVVKVYEQSGENGERPKGIPFVAKKVMLKQETVWRKPALEVFLNAEGDADTNKNKHLVDLGSILIPPQSLDNFVHRVLGQSLTLGDLFACVQQYERSIPLSTIKPELVSNRIIREIVLDEKRYTINAFRPIAGKTTLLPKLNPDYLLTEVNAEVEDKTISALLDPIKDSLKVATEAAVAAAKNRPQDVPQRAKYYTCLITNILKRDQIVTLIKPLESVEDFGSALRERDSKEPRNKIEIVYSNRQQSQFKPTPEVSDKTSYKFTGTVSPPKTSN